MLPYIRSYSDSSVFYLNKVSWCSEEYIYGDPILIYEQKSMSSTSVVFSRQSRMYVTLGLSEHIAQTAYYT